MKMLHSATLAIVALASTHQAQGKAPLPLGTYRIAVCARQCAATDSAQALTFGLLVIDTMAVDSVNRQRLAPDYFYFHRPPLRACYRIKRTTMSPALYAGIRGIGLTAWERVGADSIAFQLYRSVDASYQVTVRVLADSLRGVGWDAGFGVEEIVKQHVEAIRIGAPDMRQCWP